MPHSSKFNDALVSYVRRKKEISRAVYAYRSEALCFCVKKKNKKTLVSRFHDERQKERYETQNYRQRFTDGTVSVTSVAALGSYVTLKPMSELQRIVVTAPWEYGTNMCHTPWFIRC